MKLLSIQESCRQKLCLWLPIFSRFSSCLVSTILWEKHICHVVHVFSFVIGYSPILSLFFKHKCLIVCIDGSNRSIENSLSSYLFFLTAADVLLVLLCFRLNLKGLYKGDIYSIYNSQKTIRPSKPGIVCWMGLTGYQAAIVCLGKTQIKFIHFDLKLGSLGVIKQKFLITFQHIVIQLV